MAQQITKRWTDLTRHALDAKPLREPDGRARKLAKRADVHLLAVDGLALKLLAEHRCSRKPLMSPSLTSVQLSMPPLSLIMACTRSRKRRA